MSVKQYQSEIGVSGEPSPNVTLMEEVTKLLDKFEHDHDSITCYDNFILLCGMKFGDKVYDKTGIDKGLGVLAQMVGCYEDIASTICAFLIENKQLLPVFTIAINEAIKTIEENEQEIP